MFLMKREWDPTAQSPGKPSATCLNRVKKDLSNFHKERPPGIYVASDETDMTLIHALIVGPDDTPYEKGFFYFVLRVPSEYPIRPPTVKLMTTGGSTVRFNPNLYQCGKVCLSILGTWGGPAWSPAHTLSSVLISIQSLLNERPYHNEPGYEREVRTGEANRYNEVIQHETLRVAVIGMVEHDFRFNIPDSLNDIVNTNFIQFYSFYVSLAKKKEYLDKSHFNDPFGSNRGTFQYSNLLKRLETAYVKLKDSFHN